MSFERLIRELENSHYDSMMDKKTENEELRNENEELRNEIRLLKYKSNQAPLNNMLKWRITCANKILPHAIPERHRAFTEAELYLVFGIIATSQLVNEYLENYKPRAYGLYVTKPLHEDAQGKQHINAHVTTSDPNTASPTIHIYIGFGEVTKITSKPM